MLSCSVTLVLIPEIVGDLKMKLIHKLVAVDFGYDGGCGNGDADGVSFDDWCLKARQIGEAGNAVAID